MQLMKNLKRSITICLAAVLGLGLGMTAEAQVTTASISGTVQDSTNAVVPGATVEVRNNDTGLVRTEQTSASGLYELDFLPIGTYTVTISHAGFTTTKRLNLALTAAEQLKLDISLQTANVSVEVDVSASGPTLDTSSSQDTSTLEVKQLNQLPLAHQDWTTLLTQDTGSIKQNSNTNSTFNLGLSLNGLPSAGFNLTVDGTNAAADPEVPLFGFYQAPNIINTIAHDAIREVSIVKGVSSAAVGGAMSGSINMITKSGTNNWHGTLSETNEVSALDARSYFSTTKPRLTYNQYGAALGGPILHDKLFFFLAYEGARLSRFQVISGSVPTPYAYNVSPAIYHAMLNRLPKVAQPTTDPAACSAAVPDPYANNCSWTATYTGVGSNQQFDSSIVARIDENLTSRDSWYARYTRNRPYLNSPALNPFNPQITTAHGDDYNVGYVHVFHNLSSNSRFGYNRLRFNRGQLGFYTDQESVGTQGFSTGSSEVFTKAGRIVTGDQELSMTLGRHNLQFGGIVQRNDSGRTDGNTASFSYPNLCAVANVAPCPIASRNSSYLNNVPSAVKIGYDVLPFDLYQWQYGGYLQDDWKVNDRLTLNLGLRYDYYTVMQEVNGRVFNHGYSDDGGYGFGPYLPANQMYNPDYHTGIQPRVGFAYSPRGTQTVVRGGFGIVTGRMPFFAGPIGLPSPASATSPGYQTLNAAQSAALQFPIMHQNFPQAIAFLQSTINPATQQPYIGTSFANTSLDPHHNNPYSMQWTLGIEQALPARMVLDMSYAGNVGLNETLTYVANLSARNQPQGQPLIPNPEWSTFLRYIAGDRSNYHALDVKLRKTLQWGLSYGANFTWAKSLSYGDANLLQGTSPQNLSDLRSDYGPSGYDIRENFSANVLWEIPFERWAHTGSTLANTLGRGWRLSAVVNANTGLPASLTNSASTFTADRPNAPTSSPYVTTYKAPSTKHTFLLKSVFAAPLVTNGIQVTPGTIGRNAIRNVGQQHFDLGATKDFVLPREMRLGFRVDAFNAFNHTNFTGLVTDYNSSNFGVFQSAAANRTIQLGGRFTF
jgi:outer membrane receptor protein involved in Fe transport